MLLRDPADLRIGRHEDHRVERHLGGIERLTERVEAARRLADRVATASAGRPSTNATAPSAARRKHRLNGPE